MANLGSELDELIPLALVIALSPLSIIPAVLVLHTPRPRPTSLAFLVGWVAGIAVLTAAFLGLSHALGGLNGQPRWSVYLRIAVGVALIGLGLYRWLNRRKAEHSPAWMRSMSGIGPQRALLTAVVLAVVNPKVLFMCAAAGLVIGTAGLGVTGSWTAVVAFTALAASSVALPVLAYQVAGPRLDAPLERLKTSMEANHAVLVAAILILIGAALLYKGVHAL